MAINTIYLYVGVGVFLVSFILVLLFYFWWRSQNTKVPKKPDDLLVQTGFTDGRVSTAPTETSKPAEIEKEIEKDSRKVSDLNQTIKDKEGQVSTVENKPVVVVPDTSAEDSKKYWDTIVGK
ncbi:MAG: hypothetical protein WC511_02920 [Candidatus Pacearchaeota archaeon]